VNRLHTFQRAGSTALGCLTVAIGLLLSAPLAAQALSFVPGSTNVTAFDADGILATQAGSHPDSFKVEFKLKQEADDHTEGGEARDVIVDLPPGFVGNASSMPTCSRQQFEGTIPHCPGSTQVGIVEATVFGLPQVTNPIYNVEPARGTAAQLGFAIFNWSPLQNASVRTDDGYGLSVATPNLPVEVSSVAVTVWGTPSDKSHDSRRVCADGAGGAITGCSADVPHVPYLTMPTACGPFETTIRIDSKQNPDVYVPETVPLRDAGGNPAPIIGCGAVPFDPRVTATTTTPASESPSGLAFGLELPDEGLLDPGALAETQPVRTEIDFPPGITVNPAAANGIGVCSEAQFSAAACPQAAKIGTLLARTPLLDEPIEGSFYLATPHANPFGSLIALYILAEIPDRGVLVRQAGEVEADPQSGRLSSSFDHLPPIPYSSFDVRLREGPRAPLITPQTCGSFSTTVRLYPFSDPGSAVSRSAPLKITSGADGAACASSESELPNRPSLESGSLSPLAGAYSPFITKLTRADGTQRFKSLSLNLPPGLTARLAGTAQCADAQIAAAEARRAFGDGALERAVPSCPAASKVGILNVGAGAGPAPYYAQGNVYLAGPYRGAPVSLAVITPAVAGPFDLGVVLARAALYVDEQTAQVTVRSDEIPQILEGIPLDVRSLSVQVDRGQFALNPTNCEAMSVSGSLTSTLGQLAPLANRFQVGGCRGLGLKPNLQIRLKGPTRRTSNPKLIATLTPRPGDANLSFAQVTLPKAAFLDNAHIGTICTRVQFNADPGNGAQCPPGSIYGKAEATTPLLDYPLKGTVFLRASDNPLPDLLVAFSGPPSQPIHFALAGKTDAVNGALRNTFQAAPDVPVSKFRLELFGGKRGLVELSSGLCKHRAANVRFRGHNGREYSAHPTVVASCPKRSKQSAAKR
jgi:hypothetical protein